MNRAIEPGHYPFTVPKHRLTRRPEKGSCVQAMLWSLGRANSYLLGSDCDELEAGELNYWTAVH